MNDNFPEPTSAKWEHYQLLVINELRRLNQQDEKLNERLTEIHTDLIQIKTTMKVRATIFGFIAGALGTFVGLLVEVYKTK